MVPIGDVLHPGVIAEPRPHEPRGEGVVCVQLTPPMKAEPPFQSSDYVRCPADRITVGWL